MAPPSISHRRLLSASPRPVPPYLRVVELFGLGEGWKIVYRLGRSHADPRVADREGRAQGDSVSHPSPLPASRITRTILRELGRVAEQVEQDLAHFGLIAVHGAGIAGAAHGQRVAVSFAASGRTAATASCINGMDAEHLQVQIVFPASISGEIEHIVDQVQQMLAGAGNVRQVRRQTVSPLSTASSCSSSL